MFFLRVPRFRVVFDLRQRCPLSASWRSRRLRSCSVVTIPDNVGAKVINPRDYLFFLEISLKISRVFIYFCVVISKALFGLMLMLHVHFANSLLAVSEYFMHACSSECCESDCSSCNADSGGCCEDNCHVVKGVPMLTSGTLSETSYAFLFSPLRSEQSSWFGGEPLNGFTRDHLRPPHACIG